MRRVGTGLYDYFSSYRDYTQKNPNQQEARQRAEVRPQEAVKRAIEGEIIKGGIGAVASKPLKIPAAAAAAVAALAEEGADGVAWAREGFLTGNPVEYPPISWELLLEKLKEMGIIGVLNLAVNSLTKRSQQ